MKKLVQILLFSLFSSSLFAQSANDIVGYWYGPQEKDGGQLVIELFERNGRYYAYGFAYKGGSSASMRDDVQNPDPSMRGRSLTGAIFVYDVFFDTKKKGWVGGEIYRPTDGKYFYLASKNLSEDKNRLTWRASFDKGGNMGADLHWMRIPTAEVAAYMVQKPSMERVLATMPKTRQKK